jgi:cyclopropane fatty-acyl-phospholipid synthase-like methyltransferase
MSGDASSHTRGIARQYDLFQTSLEFLDRERKFLNYGYTISGRETYEERQQRLCLEVFDAAEIGAGHIVVDVGFGSGEQDFLLSRTCTFARLIGFNISERQVRYASDRARRERLDDRLSFHLGEAEVLPGVDEQSIDRILAIECAFYFDRPRFYRRAAEVLRPGGRMALADIAFSDRLASLPRRDAGCRRVGTRSSNRTEWGKHFRTRSVRSINRWTRPGAQMTVFEICRTAPFSRLGAAERRAWMKMALSSQVVALGLRLGLIHYDLIVLEKPNLDNTGANSIEDPAVHVLEGK